jgi:hypothetical protein
VSSDPPFFDEEQRAEVARKVAARRVKRRLKAAASIGLAVLAGAFLACAPHKPQKERTRVPVPPNPTTPGVGAIPAPSSVQSEGARAESSASSSAIVPAPEAPPQKAPTVDKREHRKGMPVPDNLLE